jgi:hypothetical protein
MSCGNRDSGQGRGIPIADMDSAQPLIIERRTTVGSHVNILNGPKAAIFGPNDRPAYVFRDTLDGSAIFTNRNLIQ